MSAFLTVAGLWDPIWEDGFLFWWQVPMLLVLAALVVGWIMYRRRQM